PIERRGQLVDQRACAESIGRFFQCPVGRRSDDTVDEQTAMLLECPDRGIEMVIEGGRGVFPVFARVAIVDTVVRVQEPQACQGAPNLCYGWTGIAVTKSVHA